MPTARPEIIASFALSIGLPEEEAQAILRDAAVAIWTGIPATGRTTTDRELLFELVADVASGQDAVLARLSAALPYPPADTAVYLTSAAKAFLEQAERDAAAGLHRSASVWVEIDRARGGRTVLVSGTFDPPTAKPAPSALPSPAAYADADPRSAGTVFGEVYSSVAPSATTVRASPASGSILGRVARSFRLPKFGFGARSAPPTPPPARPVASESMPTSGPVILRDSGRRVMNDPGWPADVPPPGEVEPPKVNEYRVWYGTNRRAADAGTQVFENRRGDTISYGYCDVYIPKSHKIGSIGSSLLKRLVTFTDDRLKLLCTRPVSKDGFWALVRAQIATAQASRRHAVVFIHGYNVTFEQAALRAAQIGFDLGVEGAMAFFSWPSKGTIDGYQADEATIDASEPAIVRFLVDFARKSGADAVHVIAHSMGNRGVLRAASRVVLDAQENSGVRFANFILAAPDVDADTFANLASSYGQLADRTTLYVSQRDRAVELSHWLHDYPRVGFAPPISVFDGIDTVNVTNIDLTLLGHGYVGEAAEVLNDMHSLMFERLPPERRFRLRQEQTDGGKVYWAVRA